MKSDVLNDLVVVKRSGQRVSFNGTKIAIAIKSSFDDIYDTYDESNVNYIYNKVIEYITLEYKDRKTINVEDIQDIIEKVLKESSFTDIYENFSTYRLRRKASRETYQIRREHKFVKVIEGISNSLKEGISTSPLNQLSKYGKEISKEFSKSYIIDNKYIRLHDEGSIYIHNLDMLGASTIDSYNIDLKAIDAKDLKTYTCNLKRIILGIKTDISGYVNLSMIDMHYAKIFINDYKINLKENIRKFIKLDGFEEFVNLNKINEIIDKKEDTDFSIKEFEAYAINNNLKNMFTLAHNEAFEESKLNLKECLEDLLESINNIKICLKNNAVSISVSSDITKESLIVKDTLIEILKKGNSYDSIHFIFKIKENTKFDNLLELNNKNIYYLNDIYEDVEYFPNGEKAYENYWTNASSAGKMVNAIVSINLPRLGIISKDKEEFYNLLDEQMDNSKNILLQCFEQIANKYKDNFSYLFNTDIFTNIDIEENQKIRKLIKNGTLEIGFIGLHECMLALNKKYEESDALELLEHMYNKCNEYTQEEKLNFSLTSINNTKVLSNLIKIDKSVYGNLLNITDKKMYSSKLDIDYSKYNDVEKYLTGGILSEVYIKDKLSIRKQIEEVNNLLKNKVMFFKIIKNNGDEE